MSPMPLPIRLAAGLAAVAVERARRLPQDVTEWPMSAVSQALQLSMRVQQRITELAIKGDEAIAGLREIEEDPPWAVFDEDLPAPGYLRPARSAYDLAPEATDVDRLPTGLPNTADLDDGHAGEGPRALPRYPELSLASMRARLRTLSVDDLGELLTYERDHQDRPEFVRMLTNRIATVQNR